MGTNQPGTVVATVSTGTGYSRYFHVAANRLLRLYKTNFFYTFEY